ncbi:hypothetical protein HAX54_014721, partial [Datura stramonium]|nr:hypothetical protein [Datura stramonium]
MSDRRSVSSIVQGQQKIPETKLTESFNGSLKDGPSFQKMVRQLKDRLKLGKSEILNSKFHQLPVPGNGAKNLMSPQ